MRFGRSCIQDHPFAQMPSDPYTWGFLWRLTRTGMMSYKLNLKPQNRDGDESSMLQIVSVNQPCPEAMHNSPEVNSLNKGCSFLLGNGRVRTYVWETGGRHHIGIYFFIMLQQPVLQSLRLNEAQCIFLVMQIEFKVLEYPAQ